MYVRINNNALETKQYVKINTQPKNVLNVYTKTGPIYKYSYDVSGWGNCNVTCGGGTQTRTVQCKRKSGLNTITVDDIFCNYSGLQKPNTSQICNTQACAEKCQYHLDTSTGGTGTFWKINLYDQRIEIIVWDGYILYWLEFHYSNVTFINDTTAISNGYIYMRNSYKDVRSCETSLNKGNCNFYEVCRRVAA